MPPIRSSAWPAAARIALVLILCGPLVLTACGGGYLPTHAPQPSATVRAASTRGPARLTPSPALTASPTPSPVNMAAVPDKAPEFSTGLIPAAERDRYTSLIAALRAHDEVAAGWLVSTGYFLRDGRLDATEFSLLDSLATRKDDPLWIVTNTRLLVDLDEQGMNYLRDATAFAAATWYFDDDMQELDAAQLLTGDRKRSLNRIFARAKTDPEVRKGLYLINALGAPDAREFKYAAPAYNVQLWFLACLLEQGVPGDYEGAAVAAALTYGSLASLCDDAARAQVLSYATERVRFLIQTDVLLAASGAGWRATHYPLEDQIVLLWGGQSSVIPQAGQPMDKARGLLAAASERPLTKADLASLLVPIDTLQAMQDTMLRAVVERSGDEATATGMMEKWWQSARKDEPDEGGPSLAAQWQRYRAGRGFAGGAASGYVLQGLAASVNLPLPWAQLWYASQGTLQVLPGSLRLDPDSRALLPGPEAQQALDQLPADARLVLVWYRIPWDNWHQPAGERSVQTVALPRDAWKGGVPSGYLWRAGVMSEADARVALGLPAPATPTPAPAH